MEKRGTHILLARCSADCLSVRLAARVGLFEEEESWLKYMM